MSEPQVEMSKLGINNSARKEAFKLAYGIGQHPTKCGSLFCRTSSTGNGLLKNKNDEQETIDMASVVELASALMDNVISKGCFNAKKSIAKDAKAQLYSTPADSNDPSESLKSFAKTIKEQLSDKKFNADDRLATHLDFLRDVCQQELHLEDDNEIVASLSETLRHAQRPSNKITQDYDDQYEHLPDMMGSAPY